MGRADKKQRHKAKRDAKRLETRRRNAISPLKRLADAGGEPECWMSDSFAANGQAQVFVYKQAAGLSGIACFLIDRGVVGLKDAWSRVGIERSEFNEILEKGRRSGLGMLRVNPEVVRNLIAGGVRWAHDNGMRLPKDWVKVASLIGGVGDWASADVSEFVREFAGHPDDLRQRLIGEPLDTYLRRTDVSFIFSEDAPYMNQETGEYDEWDDDENQAEMPIDSFSDEIRAVTDALNPQVQILAGKTFNFLKAAGRAPSPELIEVCRDVVFAGFMARQMAPGATDEELVAFTEANLEIAIGKVPSARKQEYRHAMEQMQDYMKANPLPIPDDASDVIAEIIPPDQT